MTARSMLERLRWRCQAESHAELARYTGLGPHLIRRILRGEAKPLWVDDLIKVARAAEIPVGMLAEWYAEREEEGLQAAAQMAGYAMQRKVYRIAHPENGCTLASP